MTTSASPGRTPARRAFRPPLPVLLAAGLAVVLIAVALRPRGGGPDPAPAPPLPPPAPHGRFVGKLRSEALDDGRTVRLLADFAYVDPAGVVWDAPAGWEVDGASIPRAFWSVIGGPLSGKYRRASVIHDVACDRRAGDWRAAHQAFYDACLCGGVSNRKAWAMYLAVRNFGPRWPATFADRDGRLTTDGAAPPPVTLPPQPTEAEAAALFKQYLRDVPTD